MDQSRQQVASGRGSESAIPQLLNQEFDQMLGPIVNGQRNKSFELFGCFKLS